jgi:hypothetical protein
LDPRGKRVGQKFGAAKSILENVNKNRNKILKSWEEDLQQKETNLSKTEMRVYLL